MDNKATETVRKRCDRLATVYDFMEGFAEKSRYSKWRQLLWSKVEGKSILEVGVGTGKNFLFYPRGVDITAIDFSDRILSRARYKAQKQGIKVALQQMDIQQLDFSENIFDTVVSTFVFCSIPDPVRGLKEVKRVCKANGKIIFLEHVLSANRIIAMLMNIANPMVARVMGANINRQTLENVRLSGIKVEKVTNLVGGIFKLIEARKG